VRLVIKILLQLVDFDILRNVVGYAFVDEINGKALTMLTDEECYL
jgi:hypothetical protein